MRCAVSVAAQRDPSSSIRASWSYFPERQHQRYLTLGDVLELYGLIIGATLAEAADQLCNCDGLESALARPAAYAHYEDADLALQAAVLAHGIAEGQQFIDGNKRTALVAMAREVVNLTQA